jgi:uncharacterized protein YkwD
MLRSRAMRGLAVAVAMIGLAGCSGMGPQRIGVEPSWRGRGPRTSVAGPVTFAPTTEAAARYNDPLRLAPHSPLGDAVTAAVTEAATRAGLRVPAPDARLFRACAELAEVVPEEGIPGYAIVEFALQRNGIIEPSPQLLIVWGDIDSPDVIVKQLQPRLTEILAEGATARLGVGSARRSSDGTGAVVFALQGSGVATAPIPRVTPAGSDIVIDAVVDPRYRDPEVFVTRSDGTTQRLELKLKGDPGSFVSGMTCNAKGRHQLEITASDAMGSTVLANFPVWCGVAPPQSVTVDPARDDEPAASPEEAEQRLLANVNRDRAAAGLAALVSDERLAAVARGYSEEMRRTRVVAHVSPTSGSSADRVRAANIRTGVVLENVARAYGVNEAHQGLMNSPGHRANLMSAIATHIGIGVALGEEISGRREIFITQVFTRVPPKLDPAKAFETVRQKLQAARSMVAAARLQLPAQQFASALASGLSRDAAYDSIRGQLTGLGRHYQRVGSVITATADLDSFDGASVVAESAGDEVGIGIAQGPHPDYGERAIWIVILLALRR